MRELALAMILVLLAGTAKAAMIGGAGMGSCEMWTTDRRSNNGGLYGGNSTKMNEDIQWVLGFLSGIALVGSKNGVARSEGLNVNGVVVWIDGYCQTHRNDTILNAAAEFYYAHPDR